MKLAHDVKQGGTWKSAIWAMVTNGLHRTDAHAMRLVGVLDQQICTKRGFTLLLNQQIGIGTIQHQPGASQFVVQFNIQVFFWLYWSRCSEFCYRQPLAIMQQVAFSQYNNATYHCGLQYRPNIAKSSYVIAGLQRHGGRSVTLVANAGFFDSLFGGGKGTPREREIVEELLKLGNRKKGRSMELVCPLKSG